MLVGRMLQWRFHINGLKYPWCLSASMNEPPLLNFAYICWQEC